MAPWKAWSHGAWSPNRDDPKHARATNRHRTRSHAPQGSPPHLMSRNCRLRAAAPPSRRLPTIRSHPHTPHTVTRRHAHMRTIARASRVSPPQATAWPLMHQQPKSRRQGAPPHSRAERRPSVCDAASPTQCALAPRLHTSAIATVLRARPLRGPTSATRRLWFVQTPRNELPQLPGATTRLLFRVHRCLWST